MINGTEKSAERPLAGAVICCTSVPAELRTRYAEYVQQMGAEHKLDLTSDVTHLLVGDPDTPKYKYVAKERADVKVLRPEWVEAVRDCWMAAKRIDLNALEAAYQLPTLFALKICITGFDDLNFRAQLQKNVIENGGEYTKDLTKDVTHLIAARPEGKKFEYGVQWQKKVVGLKWYKDTLDRGMQLDETLYHPTRPVNEQGVGAWNRQTQPQTHLGKRPRDDSIAAEPARKLRRTASARLGSQNDNLWTDIVAGVGFETADRPQPVLRTAKSVPAMRTAPSPLIGEARTMANHNTNASTHPQGFLHGQSFIVYGFEPNKDRRLQEIIRSNGGAICNSFEAIRESGLSTTTRLLLVPHDMPVENATALQAGFSDAVETVSEIWLEWCMFRKAFVNPDAYPLGGLRSKKEASGLSQLRINATGFHGLETLHISKVMTLMGAKYEEVFTANVSVLVCKSTNVNTRKLDHAQQWGVPVVSEAWVWSCIKNHRKAPFESYLIRVPRTSVGIKVKKDQGFAPINRPAPAKAGRSRSENIENRSSDFDLLPHDSTTNAGIKPNFRVHEDKPSPGTEFCSTEAHASLDVGDTISGGKKDQLATEVVPTPALKEISPNSPRGHDTESSIKPKKRLFVSGDGQGDSTGPSERGEERSALSEVKQSNTIAPVSKNAQGLNGAIQDLLNMRARAKSTKGSEEEDIPKSKKLQGRALSNLSNASGTSTAKRSRASSVDTMNTDGIGSEIAPVNSNGSRTQEQTEGPNANSFMGRAKTKLSEPTGMANFLGEPVLYGEETAEEEAATPQLTQLGYEDPEEAVLLREKLAENRRRRTQLGQNEEDPPPVQPKEAPKIRDDDVLANAGWGAGRRTRNKEHILDNWVA